MVYTVTFNPAVDYVVKMSDISLGRINRTACEEIFPGGKGINVSIVLQQLGVTNCALGFSAGFTGIAIEAMLAKKGVKTDFVKLKDGFSRINVKLRAGEETEINGQGPEIPEEKIQELLAKLGGLASGDIVVLAGSVPSSISDDIYERILCSLETKGILAVVDATGDLLKNVLKYRPFLIKPNNNELGEIFGRELKSVDEIIDCASKLKEMGARNVLISMAGDGAILLDETGKVHQIGVPQGKVVNSVGAGDSMVAGFIAGYLDRYDYDYALKLGTAAGSATAFSEGIAEREDIFDTLIRL